jgi:phospholipid/cholesterol/gamma-HCH transport system substrate-binding protein
MTGHLITALLAIGVAAAATIWLIALGGNLRVSSDYEVRVVLPHAATLSKGARVTMAGAPVGKVAQVKRKGSGAEIKVALNDDRVYPLPVGSTARLRAVTAVQENYLEIIPGRSRAQIADGGTLTAATIGAYVEPDEILSLLQGKTRERARDLVQGLGGGLRDRGEDLHRTVSGTAGTLIPLAQTMQTLAADRHHVARLTRQLGEVAAAAGSRGEAIRVLARDSAETFRTAARRDRELRALIDALPAMLRQVRGTTGLLASVSRTGTPVVADVASAIAEARPLVADLRPAAQSGREAARNLESSAPVLTQVLKALTRASAPAATAVTVVRGVTCETTPLLRYLEPYRHDVTSFVGSFGSSVNAYDALGHLVKLQPVLGENSLAGLPDAQSELALKLVHEGVFSRSTSLNWNPYPRPGQIGKSSALGSPAYKGPEDFAKRSGFTYPRIKADC